VTTAASSRDWALLNWDHMHIVDTTLFFAPNSGGVKRYLLTKQRFLATQSGVRHTIVVPGSGEGPVNRGLVEVPSPLIPFANGYRLPIDTGAWTDKLLAIRPDVIEAGDPYHIAWAALRAADRLGVPAVAFVHSDLSRLIGARFGQVLRAAVDVYLRNLYDRFDLVMAPSQSIAKCLRELGVERTVVQPLGVDTTLFHPSCHDPMLRAELGLPNNTRLLIYAGRISSEKRIPLIQRAIEMLGPPYHLLIVGGNQRRRLSPRQTLLPYEQDTARLTRLLASCDALIHAGEHETFGLVFLEAMACGRPVIGVRSGAVTEIVDASVGQTAAPGDVESIAEAVRALYEGDIELLGKQARERVERRYTWETTLTKQMARYAYLVRRNKVFVGTVPVMSDL
jgi:alpha-1,6-mannosyltransferase